jgi:hypothetical protein
LVIFPKGNFEKRSQFLHLRFAIAECGIGSPMSKVQGPKSGVQSEHRGAESKQIQPKIKMLPIGAY